MKIWRICFFALGIAPLIALAEPAEAPDPLDDEVEQVIAFLQAHIPEAVASVNELRESDPDAFRVEIRLLSNQIRQLRQVDVQSPEIGAMMASRFWKELYSRGLARKVLATPDGPGKNELVNQLRTMLEELFELRLQLTEAELAALEQDVLRLREALQRRRSVKIELIEGQLQAILSDDR
jgi:hypothetical protein